MAGVWEEGGTAVSGAWEEEGTADWGMLGEEGAVVWAAREEEGTAVSEALNLERVQKAVLEVMAVVAARPLCASVETTLCN